MAQYITARSMAYSDTNMRQVIHTYGTQIEQTKEHISLIATDQELEELESGEQTMHSKMGEIEVKAGEIDLLVETDGQQGLISIKPTMMQLIADNINLTGNVIFQSALSNVEQSVTDYASSAVNWVSSYGSEQKSVSDMVKGWIVGAVSSTTKINGGWIATNTITAEQCDINSIFSENITVNNRLLLANGYLTTNTARTSYNQSVAGMTFDSGGIGGWSSANRYFYASNDGKLTASDVTISGVINATSGSFTGTVNATSGSIGGFGINNGSLYSQNPSNNILFSNPSNESMQLDSTGILFSCSAGTISLKNKYYSQYGYYLPEISISSSSGSTKIAGNNIYCSNVLIGSNYKVIHGNNNVISLNIGTNTSGGKYLEVRTTDNAYAINL